MAKGFPQENEWTITAEWDLVCERAFLAPLITTTYFCGVMVIRICPEQTLLEISPRWEVSFLEPFPTDLEGNG